MGPEDRRQLAHAVGLAAGAQPWSSPNPAVGCVLVAAGAVVATGATQPPGGAHAEQVALQQAEPGRARGATAYVTLTPCGHHGRTPPCADALVAAGVARVVVGIDDPYLPAAAGIATLRAAGIDVEFAATHSWLADTIRRQLAGYLTRQRIQRPWVTLKWAMTPDGALSVPGRRWITGRAARAAVHRWRYHADAVLVGVGTVLADDPRLTARREGVRCRQPRAVVIDTSLRTPIDANVVRPGSILLTTPAADRDKREALRRRGVSVIDVPPESASGQPGPRVNLEAAMQELAALDIGDVFAEPGRTLGDALLRADLVDRFVLHVGHAPRDDDASAGGGTAPLLRSDGSAEAARWPSPDWAFPAGASGDDWDLERIGGAGPDVILQWLRASILEQLSGN